jgi:hypothetical protein
MSSRNPNLLGTVYKAPTETFDVGVDFSEWLTVGDTVSSGTVTCYLESTNASATLIGAVTDDNDDEVSFVLLAAGTSGATYVITVTATTAQSDVFVAKLNLVIT